MTVTPDPPSPSASPAAQESTPDTEADAPEAPEAASDVAATGTADIGTDANARADADADEAADTTDVDTAAPEAAGTTDADTEEAADTEAPADADTEAPATPDTTTDTPDPLPALSWVDPAQVRRRARTEAPMVVPDLLSELPLRRDRAAAVPLAVIGGMLVLYIACAGLWPTTALPPTLKSEAIESQATASAAITWPANGSAAVGIAGGADVASTAERAPMASITKVVTVMAALEALPLKIGETGPSYDFTYQDSVDYWRYLGRNESSLQVPVDGSLTQYQLIEGILLGSAGNYTDRLASEIWPTNDDYIVAADAWLAKSGITGITVTEPTGIEFGNTATPAALIKLGEVAMQNPVVAEIAAKKSAVLPGAGEVENTNGIIGDPGVVGLKTGRLDGWNLLSAKNIDVDGTDLLTFAVVLDQQDDIERDASSRALYTQLEKVLQPQVAIPAGTVVSRVSTPWGASTDIVTTEDATTVLWQREATITKNAALGDDRDAGGAAGTITVNGTTGDTTVALALSDRLNQPSFWWRLTHPVELFGLR